MDEPTEPTGMQRGWEAIALRVQAELSKLVPLIPAMKPDEVKTLVDTIDNAMMMHFRAGILDKRRDLELAKITAAD